MSESYFCPECERSRPLLEPCKHIAITPEAVETVRQHKAAEDREQRFLSALLAAMVEHEWGMLVAMKAANGFLMREHVEESHPGEAERVAERTLPTLDEGMREPWLFGFRFRDAVTPVAVETSTHGGNEQA